MIDMTVVESGISDVVKIIRHYLFKMCMPHKNYNKHRYY